jgi:hypothetical protein
MKRSIVLSILLIIALILPTSATQESGNMIIKLEGYEGGRVEIVVFSDDFFLNKTGEKDTFVFNVSLNTTYHIIIEYRNTTFLKRVMFDGREVRINVATTSDTSFLKIPLMHVIIIPEDGSLSVIDVVTISNTCEKTFVGDLYISLPKGFTNLSILSSNIEFKSYVSNRHLILQNIQISPDFLARISFSYLLVSFNFSQEVFLPTDQLLMFIQSNKPVVVSPFVETLGIRQIGKEEFQIFAAKNLSEGTVYFLELKSSPADTAYLMTIAILITAGVFTLLTLLIKRRKGDKKNGDWEL